MNERDLTRNYGRPRRVHPRKPRTLAPLTLETPGVTLELLCETEHIPIDGNALASGDADEDRKQEQWVRDQLDAGNEWAWCCAHVRVTYEVAIKGQAFPARIEGNDYLGCCSYVSEADFREGGYFDDMVSEALDDLNTRRAALCGCTS